VGHYGFSKWKDSWCVWAKVIRRSSVSGMRASQACTYVSIVSGVSHISERSAFGTPGWFVLGSQGFVFLTAELRPKHGSVFNACLARTSLQHRESSTAAQRHNSDE
jgi:hypothetical protein